MFNYNVIERKEMKVMCSIRERVQIANKQFYTLEDTRKIIGVSYKTIKPLWDELVLKLKTERKMNIPGYGIRSSIVREFFGIDYDQLIREYEFERKLEDDRK